MEVTKISSTVQKFDGKSYYLCGQYFQRKGVRLHRRVWEYHNGEIPAGCHIHHKDGDRSNNDVGNLELLPGREHSSLHMREPDRREASRASIEIARKFACEWHGSAQGLEWHSRRGKANWVGKEYYTRRCDWCGEEYRTRDLGHKSGQHFCCSRHRSLATQWRLKHDGKTNYPRGTR